MTGKPRPAFSWDQIDALRAQARLDGEEAPAGKFTVYDYAERYRLPRQTADNHLRRLAAAGKLKTAMTLRAAPTGRRYLTRVYWPV